MTSNAAIIEAQLEAEGSPDGAGRKGVSGTVESLRHRDCSVRYAVEVGGKSFVEQTVGAHEPFDEGQTVEQFPDQDELIAFDPGSETVGGRW